MSEERISIALLARELGLKPNKIMELGQSVGVHRTRVAATLPKAEADKIRLAAAEEARHRDRFRPRPVVHIDAAALAAAASQPCSCCGLDTIGQEMCAICKAHHYLPREPADRRDDRLADHRRRLGHFYSPALAELDEQRNRMRSALRSRDAWIAALVEVMVHHDRADEGCRCGAPHYPCPSVETLERVNRGIARRVESYLAMTPEEMQIALHGDGVDAYAV